MFDRDNYKQVADLDGIMYNALVSAHIGRLADFYVLTMPSDTPAFINYNNANTKKKMTK